MRTSFFDIENWREIIATLARNKTRTFLTAFGIFWGTALLAMLWGGAAGLEGIMRRQFAGFATNMGGAFPSRTTMSYRGFNKGMHWNMTTQDVDNIRRVAPYIDKFSSIVMRYSQISYSKHTTKRSVMGIDSDYNNIMTPITYEGRLINESDVRECRKVAVCGKNVATELFGSESPIGKYISVDGIYFIVVGVAGQRSDATLFSRVDDSVILPSATMRYAFNLGTNVAGVFFTATEGHTPSDNTKAIRRAVCSNHPIHPEDEFAVSLFDLSENFKMIDKLFVGISLLALFVGAGSLMAGIIGVGNIMWIIVRERTQEIGIRRAIGAKLMDIIMQVLSESIVLTTVAGIAGVCFATIVLGIADMATADPMHGNAGFEITFNEAISIVGIFFILGTLAGTLPAVKAMKIKPVEAMRDK